MKKLFSFFLLIIFTVWSPAFLAAQHTTVCLDPHIYHQYDVWHLAKSVTKKLGKKAKTKHCGQLFQSILTTCGGLHKHVMVMHNYLWRNENLLYTTYPMSTRGTMTLMHCSQNVCIQHCLQKRSTLRNGCDPKVLHTLLYVR